MALIETVLCGAGFNGLGKTADITIVGGHRLGETITDQFPERRLA